jgi:hypothetical protein
MMGQQRMRKWKTNKQKSTLLIYLVRSNVKLIGFFSRFDPFSELDSSYLSCIRFSCRCQNVNDPTITGQTPTPTDPPDDGSDGEISASDDDISVPIERQTATPTKIGIAVFSYGGDSDTNTTDSTTISDDSAAASTIKNSHAASIPAAFAALLSAVWMMV